MTVDQMVHYLRLSVSIQDPEGSANDPAYLSMSDEDIILFISVAMNRNYPQYSSLDHLPTEYEYPVILLAKKELYHALATKEAPLFDIGADNNNYLKRSQRFDHYMKLISQVDSEYDDYLKNGGAGGNTLTSFDVLLDRRYFSKRSYEKGVTPALTLSVESAGRNFVEVSWMTKVRRFLRYKVYISSKPIVDLYNVSKHIVEGSKLVATISNNHQNRCRIEGLLPDTTYYVAVSVEDQNTLTGYAEESFKTLPEIPIETMVVKMDGGTDVS